MTDSLDLPMLGLPAFGHSWELVPVNHVASQTSRWIESTSCGRVGLGRSGLGLGNCGFTEDCGDQMFDQNWMRSNSRMAQAQVHTDD